MQTRQEKAEYMRRWYHANRERLNEASREYGRTHKDQIREQNKRYRDAHKEQTGEYNKRARVRNQSRHLMLTHGLSRDDYDAMLLAQNGKCAICGKCLDSSWPAKSSRGKASASPCVDHCHSTGKVRELLCVYCNLVLGNARDDTNILLGAAAYLDRYMRA
jgi:hypothetical protein